MTIAFLTHPDCLLHDMGAHHPEQPARLQSVQDQLIASGINSFLLHVDAPLATHACLARIHSARHIAAIENAVPQTGLVHLDPDTAMNPHTLTAALRAAGGAVLATDMVMAGRVRAAFCNVRPPDTTRNANTRWAFACSTTLPPLQMFAPEMVFVSAGFDAHREDDLAMLNLTEADYAWVTQVIRAVADKYAQGRIVSVLEGGYALHALGRSVAVHLKTLADL